MKQKHFSVVKGQLYYGGVLVNSFLFIKDNREDIPLKIKNQIDANGLIRLLKLHPGRENFFLIC